MAFGMLGVSLAVAWLMWGEETAKLIMLIVGFALCFMPSYMPMAAGGNLNSLQTALLENLSICGAPAILIGFFMVAGDVFGRIKTRSVQGAKANQMKYGKGIKEERDVRNVFLGKCWQLLITANSSANAAQFSITNALAGKSVGCMCEESVIRRTRWTAKSSRRIWWQPPNSFRRITSSHQIRRLSNHRQCIIITSTRSTSTSWRFR
ncbi:MAG: hypothetical protein R2688_10835 [Fimbriimonadaceae bacterium]